MGSSKGGSSQTILRRLTAPASTSGAQGHSLGWLLSLCSQCVGVWEEEEMS